VTADRALHERFVALREAWGALVVARSRGAPAAPGQTTDDLGREYAAIRRHVGARIASARPGPAPAADDWLRYACTTLEWLDEWIERPADAPAPACAPDTGAAAAADAETGADADASETPELAALRRRTMADYGAAASAVRLPDGEVVDRLTVLDRLATTADPARRREQFLALEPLWQAVDGDGAGDSPYRRLVASSAARWRRAGSPVDAGVAALGIDPASFEPMLRSVLAAFRSALGPDPIEPWDLRFVTGAADRALADALPRDRLLPIAHDHLASLGADARDLGITFDVFPRPDRPVIPVAFTLTEGTSRRVGGAWRPARPWVFATYGSGGLGNLVELFHEAGHAIHYATIRTEPHWFEPWGADGGLVEGIADVVGWDAHEPAVQARRIGRAASLRDNLLARYEGVVLDLCWTLFEIELHRHPDRRPSDAWTEITAEGLGIAEHPEWSWWATRGQLIDGPGYIANYALSAIVAAAVRARVRELRGDWTADGDTGWYGDLSERLLRHGGTRRAGPLLREFLGRPLDAAPLLADLGRM